MNIRNFIRKAVSSSLSITAIGAIALAGKSTDVVASAEEANDDTMNLLVGDQGDVGYVQSGDVANDICQYIPWLPECQGDPS